MDLFGDSDREAEGFGADLVAPAPIMKPHVTRSDFGLLDKPILLHEDLSKGCGGMIWPAGELLTKYFLKRFMKGNELKGKRIVELGAGGGMTSLAVAVGCDLGGGELFATDMDAMMGLLHQNVALNSLQDRVKVQLLDWADPLPKVIAERPVDIVLAADCVYFEPAFPLLEKTLMDLVGENSVVYFCFKKRRRADMHFVKSIKKRFHIEEVNIREDPEYASYAREALFLYILTRKEKVQ